MKRWCDEYEREYASELIAYQTDYIRLMVTDWFCMRGIEFTQDLERTERRHKISFDEVAEEIIVLIKKRLAWYESFNDVLIKYTPLENPACLGQYPYLKGTHYFYGDSQPVRERYRAASFTVYRKRRENSVNPYMYLGHLDIEVL